MNLRSWLAKVAAGFVLAGMVGSAQPPPDDGKKFAAAVRQYNLAVKSGLRLDLPGAGRMAISHASLFESYRNCFYLPAEAEPFIHPKYLNFLNHQASSPDANAAALASACVRIIRSRRKLRRQGQEKVSICGFSGALVLYHFD